MPKKLRERERKRKHGIPPNVGLREAGKLSRQICGVGGRSGWQISTVSFHPEVGPGGCETLDFGRGNPKINDPQKHEVARYPQIPATAPILSKRIHRKDP